MVSFKHASDMNAIHLKHIDHRVRQHFTFLLILYMCMCQMSSILKTITLP